MNPLLRAIFAAAVASIAIAACVTDDPDESACLNIPDGGCPLAYGVACEDPSCAAAYACNPDGTWTLSQVCPLIDAGLPSEAGDASDASDALLFSGFDVSHVDAPPGTYGGSCSTDIPLQDGDCQLGVVLSCGPNVDPCCGCQNLFICANDGWTPWGSCSDDTGLVIGPDFTRSARPRR